MKPEHLRRRNWRIEGGGHVGVASRDLAQRGVEHTIKGNVITIPNRGRNMIRLGKIHLMSQKGIKIPQALLCDVHLRGHGFNAREHLAYCHDH